MADFEGMEEEEEEDETMSGLGPVDLLWKGVVKPDEPLIASGVDEYVLHITNASLGPDVNEDTRTSLLVVQASDDESEPPGVVCTLKNTYENHKLDLIASEDVQFQVAGKNPSPIYLVGYLSPAEQYVAENPAEQQMYEDLFAKDDDDEEPTEEELQEMDAQTKKQLLKQLARRGFNAAENEDEGKASGQKKQKGAAGKEKNANPSQDKNQNKNKNQKNDNKANNQKSKETNKDNDEDKPWKNGPQGLKFKDIRVGDGKAVQKGSKVAVYYVGQLDNKTVFDKSISGRGFEFTLGAGEVIKGWDLGVNGMKVGGKRRLQIPAKLAYGKEGSPPDIPPNAQLTFTVEIRSAN